MRITASEKRVFGDFVCCSTSWLRLLPSGRDLEDGRFFSYPKEKDKKKEEEIEGRQHWPSEWICNVEAN